MRPQKKTRHLLLVCYHFARPRHTGGMRWRALARGLVRRGWRLDVLCKDPREPGEQFAPRPPNFGSRIAPHLISQHWWGQRLRLTARTAEEWVQHMLPLNAGASRPPETVSPPVNPDDLFVWTPGHRPPLCERIKNALVGTTELMRDAVWTRRAWRVARMLARRRRYRAVVVTSPRHLNHVIGALLARRFGVPYVADYRDPWYFGRCEDRTLLDGAKRRVARRCEAWTLRYAHAAVDIAERAGREAESELAEQGVEGPPRHFIRSGYVPSEQAPPPPDPECFQVVYTGWLWPFMDVRPVLAACGRLRRRHVLDPETLRVAFVGTDTHLNGVPLDGLARTYGLSDCFEHRSRLSPEEAEAIQQRAAVMVAFDSVCARGLCIPSKLYHYAKTRGALLLVGHPDGAMAEEAAKIGVETHAPSDTRAIERVLETAYQRWRRDGFEHVIDAHGRFEMRHASTKMHDLLQTLEGEWENRPAPQTTPRNFFLPPC